ncbi:uncharacterized protein LOC117102315 isoform X2 [Anneissia japonica]|nr:uncharacterized protein LOC117102315 isoform X2 [Anneissia japonica]
MDPVMDNTINLPKPSADDELSPQSPLVSDDQEEIPGLSQIRQEHQNPPSPSVPDDQEEIPGLSQIRQEHQNPPSPSVPDDQEEIPGLSQIRQENNSQQSPSVPDDQEEIPGLSKIRQENHIPQSPSVSDDESSMNRDSDSSWIPSTCNSETFSDGEEIPGLSQIRQEHQNPPSPSVPDDQEEIPGLSKISQENHKDSQKNDNKIIVQCTSNIQNQRVFDKKFPCIYCSKFYSQIQRHLREQHHTEPDVIAIMNEKDRKKKSDMMDLIRNKGTHRHNCSVIRNGEGKFIVSYRPSHGNAKYDDYGPCEFCLGYFIRTDLWKHDCHHKSAIDKVKYTSRPALSSKLLVPPPKGTSLGLYQVTQKLSNDDISRVAKNDPLILENAQRHFMKCGHDVDQHCDIRTKMREAARLLIDLRIITKRPNASMHDFMKPAEFRNVVLGVQRVAGFDENMVYKTPSLALKLGHTLQKFAKIVQGQASEINDDEMYKNAKAFSKRIQSEWSVFVSSVALRTMYDAKRNRPKLLPLTNDVMRLTNQLKEVGNKNLSILNDTKNTNDFQEAWINLAEVTLAQIVLFNRRRTGEVSKMKLEDFKFTNRLPDSIVSQSLSPVEKELCKTLKRVEVKGKRGRTVPILLTDEMSGWLQTVVARRPKTVKPQNPFVFPRTYFSSLGHIRASDVLRKYSNTCGADNPETLRGTKLRKQLATLCQILNLQEHELDIVANFMGHDLRVHRNYYRLPDNVLQVSKVSKILLAVEKGVLAPSKSLDDIPLDEEELVEVDEEEHEVEDDDELQEHSVESLHSIENIVSTDRKESAKCSANQKMKSRKQKHVPWNKNEKDVLMKHFHKHILTKQLPGKKEIDRCLKEEPALHRRSWKNIKDYVRNNMVKKSCL